MLNHRFMSESWPLLESSSRLVRVILLWYRVGPVLRPLRSLKCVCTLRQLVMPVIVSAWKGEFIRVCAYTLVTGDASSQLGNTGMGHLSVCMHSNGQCFWLPGWVAG